MGSGLRASAQRRKARLCPLMRVELSAHPSSARLARQVVRELCEQANLDVDTSLLCVSELVTNALLHAAPPFELEVVVNQRSLRVAVRDGSIQQVLPRQPVRDDATSGRGLEMVGALATRWGVDTGERGKVVWFELDASG